MRFSARTMRYCSLELKSPSSPELDLGVPHFSGCTYLQPELSEVSLDPFSIKYSERGGEAYEDVGKLCLSGRDKVTAGR